MIGKVIGIAIVLIISFAAFQLYNVLFPPLRAIYLRIPAVSGVNESCVYNNVVDVIEVNFDGNFFTAEELIGLSCSDSREYSVAFVVGEMKPDQAVH